MRKKIVLLFCQQSGKKCFYGGFRNIFFLTCKHLNNLHYKCNFPTIKRNFSVCKSETHVKLISRLILFICSKQLCCFAFIYCDNCLHDSNVWTVQTSDGGMCACILWWTEKLRALQNKFQIGVLFFMSETKCKQNGCDDVDRDSGFSIRIDCKASSYRS